MIKVGRPSASMVMSVLALFISLGGTGYAAVVINGKNIKAHTITGSKLKNDTLTGKQIRERTLGVVPQASAAQSAQTAQTADDASALGGLGPEKYGLARVPMLAGVANGVGNDLGCTNGLAIEVDDGRGQPVDGRFSFQVAGSTPAFGVIRADGSIRTSTANVSSVSHVSQSGIYCISFSSSLSGDNLEATVASVHAISSQ